MTTDHPVSLTQGSPDTVLPAQPSEAMVALAAALSRAPDTRRAAVEDVAAHWPRFLEAWAALAELANGDVEQYAFARVGYHRGLDALRGAGWRGSGHVRWRDATNRGFLRCLDLLRAAAGAIGEGDEEERCALFLRQLDPEWRGVGSGVDGS